MPAYANAHVMRDASVTIDTVEYANQVTKARLVPDTPVQTLRTLVPDGTINDVDSASWVLELSGVQSTKTGGLAKALNDAAGTEIDVVIQPKNGTGEDTATVVALAVAVEFGGTQGQFRTFEVTLPVVGEPTFGTSA